MDILWAQYQSSSPLKEKEEAWKDIVISSIEDACKGNSLLSSVNSEFANLLGSRFLSAIAEQCTLCADEPHGLLKYLSHGYGCHLLLSLNFHGGNITSCSNEISNLLLSIIQLLLKGKEDDEEDNYMHIFPLKIDPSSYKTYFQNLAMKLSGLQIKFSIHLNMSSDESLDVKEEKIVDPVVDKSKIESIHLGKRELFYHILSSLLGLAKINVLYQDSSLQISYIGRCLRFMYGRNDLELHLSYFQYYGLIQVATALLVDVSTAKDGLAELNMSNIFEDFYNVSHAIMLKLPVGVNLFLSLNIFRAVFSCIIYSLNTASNSSYMNVELRSCLMKFIKSAYFGFFKMQILLFDKESKEKTVGTSNNEDKQSPMPYEKHSSANIEIIMKQLVKICKQLKTIKGYCPEPSRKVKNSIKKRVRHRKYSEKSKHLPSAFSTDEEMKENSSSGSESHVTRDDENSTENVSDFDDDSSGSEKIVAQRETKLKPDTTAHKKEDSVCFISSCVESLVQILCKVEQSFIQEIIMRTLYHTGICNCVDLDGFIFSLLSNLPTYSESIADKLLALVTHLIVSYSDLLSEDGRQHFPQKLNTRSKVNIIELVVDTQDELDTCKMKTFQFVGKLKTYLKTPNVVLKRLILKQLKLMAEKLSQSLQIEIFSKIIFPYFQMIFPIANIKKKNVKVSLSEPTDLVDNFLELLLTYLNLGQEMVQLFHKFNGIEITKWLSRHDRDQISIRAVRILEYTAWLSLSYPANSLPLSNAKGKQKGSSDVKIDIISKDAVLAIFEIAEIFFCDFYSSGKCFKENVRFLEVLTVVENLSSQVYWQDEWASKKLCNCETLFQDLLQTVVMKREEISDERGDDSERKNTVIGNLDEKEKIEMELSKYSQWMRTLLPLCIREIQRKNKGNAWKERVTNMMKASFLVDAIFQSEIGVQIFLDIMRSSTACKRILKVGDSNVADDLFLPHTDIPLDEEKRKSNCIFDEEQGYEADRESEDSDWFPSSYTRYVPRASNNKQFTSSLTNSALNLSNPVIVQAWLCKFLLQYLAGKFKDVCGNEGQLKYKKNYVSIMKSVLNELLDYQVNSLENNIKLIEQGFLCLLFTDFEFVFTSGFSSDIQKVVGNIIIRFASERIRTCDLKAFLVLFKQPDICMDYLSSLLLRLTQISVKQFGPRNFFSFPSVINKEETLSRAKQLHRAKYFMIPKKDHQPRHLKSHSESWSSIYEVNGFHLKPIGYSKQPPGYDLAVIQFDLESQFAWPDREFSLCVWYKLDDIFTNQCNYLFEENKVKRQRSLLPQWSNEAWFEYGCEELLHLCSFGGSNAMFEVWVGARTGYLQYRWITSGQVAGIDNQLVIFDQVSLSHNLEMNKWHHLVVTLVVPSQSLTAEIFTYVDGCELPTNTMKYPSHVIHGQTKLNASLGHGIKQSEDAKQWGKYDFCRTLKTGVFMVFQGKQLLTKYKKSHQRSKKSDAVVDKVKAVYLYSLGPDSSSMDTEYQQYFSNLTANHMDSSLDWDSIVFKELSFCMSILCEDLVANGFPTQLIEDPMEILSTIKSELQSSLMIVFNPQCPKEFLQFIPQLKSSGLIQHIYITDDNQVHEGVALEPIFLSDIKPTNKETLQDALNASGGIATLLYLHALIAKGYDSEVAQSALLRVIFSLQEACPFLMREMNDVAGYVLIRHTLKFSPCEIGMVMMRAILESICDGEIFVTTDEDEHDARNIINTNTTAIVKNVCILQTILRNWFLLASSSLEVQKSLWKLLEALVRPKHPHFQFNVMQFQRARVVENLLMGCHDFQQEKENVTPLPSSLSMLYIGVIENLLGHVDLPILKAVCSFLIAIHPTLDTLTLHSDRNFYLNMKNQSISSRGVKLRKENPSRIARQRRTASLCDADIFKTDLSNVAANSPQVIMSREDLTACSFNQTEVIIHCPYPLNEKQTDNTSLIKEESSSFNDYTDKISTLHPIPVQDGLALSRKSESVIDIPKVKISEGLSRYPKESLKSHRRIRSDGNLVYLTGMKKSAESAVCPASTESQDYDIISDSELPSSCEGHEDYLVVDGFIDQTVESFTPQVKDENKLLKPDPLYYLRLGLMELLRTTLSLLPDNMITRVFGTILKVEHLLALVNQTSDKLREVALQNLVLYLQRGGRDCFANFNRFMGCHLLANQLHQHPITVNIMDSCISLLLSKHTTLNHEVSSQIDYCEENICPMAVLPCLTILEGCVQKPESFEQLTKFLIKIFNQVESLPLLAFDNGLPDIISNIILTLANENSGSMQTNWKKETFGHVLVLLDWLVWKACCTCQSLYFQMYKDLQLSLDLLDSRERLKKGITPVLLYKSCRFLKYYLIHSAMNVFKSANLYVSQARIVSKSEQNLLTSDIFGFQTISRKSSTRNLIKKIRGSAQIITPPTVATPAELQERFQCVLLEAVKLVTLFNKGDHMLDLCMYGHHLKFLKENRVGFLSEHSLDADREFSLDLLEWFFESIDIAWSSEHDNSSWYTLLKVSRDEIISQANRVILHVVSPARSKEVRLHFIRLVMAYKNNKPVLTSIIFANALSKVRDRFLACLHSILSIPHSQLNNEDIILLKKFKQLTSKMHTVKMNDQKLVEEMREIKHKRKEEEMLKRKEAFKRITDRNTSLCRNIADQGMDVSKVIVEEQDRQRQKHLRVVRGNVSKDVEVRKTWRNLIHHLTQERATWYCEESYPRSWQLDPTEGPSRMRKRLQRCHLDIASKFFMNDAPAKKLTSSNTPLSYLFVDGSDEDRPRYFVFMTNDTIRFLYHCKRVAPATKNSGEVLIGETHMYFVGDDILEDNNVNQPFFGDRDVVSISWRYEEIREILKRRYSLQDNALEIFLTSGRTFLLAFECTKHRDEVFELLMSRELPNLITTIMDVLTLTNRWKDGMITNFEYLTELNKKAGRSFNDLMQYPVFPFILADYESEVLNLGESKSFRNLSKPIACQDKSKEEHYIETYNYLKGDYIQRKMIDPDNATPPYHYSSHYSNSGTVLHFLVRLPPFTSMFLKYQDNQFDIPDRTFHSMSTTWKLSSFISNTDVKELIPEFFFLQEFFLNGERYNMGARQNKTIVDDVVLPDWSHKNARLFTLIQMQALESYYVSTNIENWIDLVFGYKQTGALAVKATNVFHPSTYFGIDVNVIKDKIQRRALQTMIETYGQTPLQLFTTPHPKRFSKSSIGPSIMEMFPHAKELNLPRDKVSSLRPDSTRVDGKPNLEKISPLSTVIGLQWGDYCASPAHPHPSMQYNQHYSIISKKIITSSKNLSAYLCGSNICILRKNQLSDVIMPIGMITWGHNDNLLRVHSCTSSKKTVFNPMRPDVVTFCQYVPSVSILFVGGASGVLNVWPVGFSAEEPSLDVIGAKQNLLGHDDAITTICVSQPYSIAITASKDKTAIIWDLNRLSYIRSIPSHENSIDCVVISDTSGDIATSSFSGPSGLIYLWTVNAKAIGKVSASSHVRCMCFSPLSDGIAINCIAAGFADGIIRIWNTWNLKPIGCLQDTACFHPIVAISYSIWDPLHLFSADSSGNIYVWGTKELTIKPTFHMIAPNI